MTLIVHGVLRASDASVLEDLGAEFFDDTHGVESDELVAVVSSAPQELGDDDAVAHLELLAAVAATVPVLPVQFGTVAPDEDAVRSEVLGSSRDSLTGLLEGIADVVELRLDLEFDEQASVRAVVAADPGLRARGAGDFESKLALGEEIAGRVAQHQQRVVDEWLQPLAATAERMALLRAEEGRFQYALLVRRDALSKIDEQVAGLSGTVVGTAVLEYVGPIPPFSFLTEGAQPQDEARTASRWGW